MTINELQQKVKDDWAQSSAGQPTVEQQVLYLMEEMGEVAEAIRKSSGNKERITKTTDIGSELADVLVCVLTLANTYNVEMDSEINAFFDRLESRRA